VTVNGARLEVWYIDRTNLLVRETRFEYIVGMIVLLRDRGHAGVNADEWNSGLESD